MKKFTAVLTVALLLLSTSFAQDKQELEAERKASEQLKGEHPLEQLIKTKTSAMKPELKGVHPRVYMTQNEIDALKAKTKSQPELWETALSRVRALTDEPAPAPAQERRVQNEVGIGIAEAAFVYKITGDKKYLDAAKKYMDAAVSYDVWGYTYNKPDVDLAAGHLLYGMGWGYDLLYNDLTPAERTKYPRKTYQTSEAFIQFFQTEKRKILRLFAKSYVHSDFRFGGDSLRFDG